MILQIVDDSVIALVAVISLGLAFMITVSKGSADDKNKPQKPNHRSL